jgi:Ceramidase
LTEKAFAAGTTLALMLLSWLLVTWLSPLSFAPASCLATHCFCEAPRAGQAVLQPANSWSSFAFVWLGSFIIAGRRDYKGSALLPGAAAVFGMASIIVGVGSFMLHATLTLWGQFADVLGMYLVATFGLVCALGRWRNWSQARSIGVFAATAKALVITLFLWPESRRWMFAVVMILALLIEIGFARHKRPRVQLRLLLIGIAANALAFGIWILDQTKRLCAPDSLFQGHAVWHLLGAVSVWMTYCYYRSERLSEGEET